MRSLFANTQRLGGVLVELNNWGLLANCDPVPDKREVGSQTCGRVCIGRYL